MKWLGLCLLGLAFFVGVTNLPKFASTEVAPWINETAASNYVGNLIHSYDAMVAVGPELKPNFTSVEQYFPLYRSTGSFEVLVLRDKPGSTDYIVGFVFEPTPSNTLAVVALTNETIQTFYSYKVVAAGTINQGYGPQFFTPYGNASFYVSGSSPQFARYIPLIWTTNTTDVLDNTEVNSKSAANVLYQESEDNVPKPPAPNPLVQLWDFIKTYIIEVAFGAIGGVASIIYLRREGLSHHQSRPSKVKPKRHR
jgi:hypothetical protein